VSPGYRFWPRKDRRTRNEGSESPTSDPAWFEGGQTPIHRRLPIKPGFRNINHKEYAVVNLDDLEKWFKAGDSVTPETIVEKSIVSDVKGRDQNPCLRRSHEETHRDGTQIQQGSSSGH